MTRHDVVGLIISYAYAFGLLLAAEAVGRRYKWPQHTTRKIVHIGAGMWVWGILALFRSRYGLIPFATFIVLNYLFYRYRIFRAMDAVDSSPGTVYFAISITVLFAVLWQPTGPNDRVAVATAAIMAMTWGDGLASIVGQSVGKHHYKVLGHQRSWEGTAAMAVATLMTVGLTLFLLPGSALSPSSAPMPVVKILAMVLTGTTIATAAEAVSPVGTDNLTVPLITGVILALFVL